MMNRRRKRVLGRENYEFSTTDMCHYIGLGSYAVSAIDLSEKRRNSCGIERRKKTREEKKKVRVRRERSKPVR